MHICVYKFLFEKFPSFEVIIVIIVLWVYDGGSGSYSAKVSFLHNLN